MCAWLVAVPGLPYVHTLKQCCHMAFVTQTQSGGKMESRLKNPQVTLLAGQTAKPFSRLTTFAIYLGTTVLKIYN